ncbi:MAG: bacillithiol system redox-active protein YtxJ [Daejeonella sp.]
MDWTPLNTQQQLQEIKTKIGYSLIFKHSTRCSISLMAKKKFELDWDSIPKNTPLYFLDLLNYRDISNEIADEFNVHHESPQLLLIKDGECIFESSHGEISAEDVTEQMII